jgi:flavorubredoxin
MNTSRQISSDLWYVGASDRRLALFENMMPIPSGTSYNSYVLTDEKTVLLDTVDQAVCAQFLENLNAVLAGRALDYIVVHHV